MAGCLKPPAALFGGHFYCRGHFVALCYERLDYCAELLRDRAFSDQTSDEMRKFIAECTQQAARLSETASNLNNIERARLLDILFYASDIGSHMRRSPRKTLTFPVRVICDSPGRQWQEDTVTRVISRFGGMFACQQTIRADDSLVVERLDLPRRAKSRLAWGWRAKSGSFVFAVEFTDCSNFWELDWSEAREFLLPSKPESEFRPVPKSPA